MVEFLLPNSFAILGYGPSLSERLHPRLTNRVTGEGDFPPRLEACSSSSLCSLFCIQILFWGIYGSADFQTVYDRVT